MRRQAALELLWARAAAGRRFRLHTPTGIGCRALAAPSPQRGQVHAHGRAVRQNGVCATPASRLCPQTFDHRLPAGHLIRAGYNVGGWPGRKASTISCAAAAHVGFGPRE